MLRKWVRRFDGGLYGKTDLDLFFNLPDWAPEYAQQDVDVLLEATRNTTHTILNVNKSTQILPLKYELPIIFSRVCRTYTLHMKPLNN